MRSRKRTARPAGAAPGTTGLRNSPRESLLPTAWGTFPASMVGDPGDAVSTHFLNLLSFSPSGLETGGVSGIESLPSLRRIRSRGSLDHESPPRGGPTPTHAWEEHDHEANESTREAPDPLASR